MRLMAYAVVAMLGAVTAAVAGGVSGSWRAEFQGPGGTTGVETLDLRVRGDSAGGTFTNALGGVGEVRDGKWDGTTLRFWVPWDGSDRLQAVGRLVDGTLQLQLKTSKWSARRVFHQVAGKSAPLGNARGQR